MTQVLSTPPNTNNDNAGDRGYGDQTKPGLLIHPLYIYIYRRIRVMTGGHGPSGRGVAWRGVGRGGRLDSFLGAKKGLLWAPDGVALCHEPCLCNYRYVEPSFL